MKLYGFGPTRSLRALWGLRELGADFEFVSVLRQVCGQEGVVRPGVREQHLPALVAVVGRRGRVRRRGRREWHRVGAAAEGQQGEPRNEN